MYPYMIYTMKSAVARFGGGGITPNGAGRYAMSCLPYFGGEGEVVGEQS